MYRRLLMWSCLSLVVASAVAQDPQEPTDPPGRVARLNFVNGTVSFRPGSQEDWGPATMNYPLTGGDHLWTDPQGGAEMHIGSTAVRLAGGTSFSVLNIDDHNGQISVSQGYLNVRLPRLDQGDAFEVDTPSGAVSLLGPGDYRVDVDPNANAMTVTVREGSAEVNGGGQTFAINSGQHVRFTGADQLTAQTMDPAVPDSWDQWCIGRDRRDDQEVAQVAQYVGNEMIGEEDLVGNGTWRSDPTYGAYWQPTTVAADWAPYRYGHWAYVEPWGWTWIDDAAWGFAPFHYGRWATIGGRWGWVPGPVIQRPVYAPALVAFVGGGGLAVGAGPVAAWVPLGPYEAFHPYYRGSDVYIGRVNFAYSRWAGVRDVAYVNRPYVTCVRQDVFVGARPVEAGFVHVPAGARFDRVDAASFHPSHEAFYGRRFEGAHFAAPPRAAFARPVIVTHAPAFRAGIRPAVAYQAAPVPTRRFEAAGARAPFRPVNAAHISNAPAYRGNANFGGHGPAGSAAPIRAAQPMNRGPVGTPNGNRYGAQPSANRYGAQPGGNRYGAQPSGTRAPMPNQSRPAQNYRPQNNTVSPVNRPVGNPNLSRQSMPQQRAQPNFQQQQHVPQVRPQQMPQQRVQQMPQQHVQQQRVQQQHVQQQQHAPPPPHHK